MRHAVLLVALTPCLLWHSVAYAYRTAADFPDFPDDERVGWSAPEVQYRLSTSLPDGLTLTELSAAVVAAAGSWNGLSCAEQTLQEGDPHDGPPVSGDGVSTIGFVLEGWEGMGFEADAAASTDVVYRSDDAGIRIGEADVFLNPALLEPGFEGLEGVLRHELGHALGLLHPCGPTPMDASAPTCDASIVPALMQPVYDPANAVLTDDDVAGFCFLYDVPEVDGCSMDVDCASERCIDGTCTAVAPEAGDPCAMDSECGAGFCHADGYCSVACAMSCPNGFRCESERCEAIGGTYGVPCGHGDDCASSLCLTGAATVCTRECMPGRCPAPDECRTIDGSDVCAPPLETNDSGCSVGGSSAGAWPFLLLLPLLFRRKR